MPDPAPWQPATPLDPSGGAAAMPADDTPQRPTLHLVHPAPPPHSPVTEGRQLSPAEQRVLWWAGVAVVMALGAALRFPNLANTPGWDSDEGYNLNIAVNLAQGHFQMFALSYAFVQHPPLFFVLLIPFIRVLGPTLLALRTFTALLGTLCLPLVIGLGRAMGGRRAGLLAGVALAVWPLAVLHNRWGYSYNLLALVGLATVLCLWKYLEASRTGEPAPRRWLALAALGAGLCVISDNEGAFVVALVWTAVACARRRDLLWAILLALAPLLAQDAILWLVAPADMAADLAATYGRVAGDPLPVKLILWVVNYQHFLDFQSLLPLGALGLGLARTRRGQALLLGYAGLGLGAILLVRDVNPFFRTAAPLLPVLAVGLGLLLDRLAGWLAPFVVETMKTLTTGLLPKRLADLPPIRSAVRMGGLLLVILALATPLALPLAGDAGAIEAGAWKTPIDVALTQHPAQARAVAAQVNALSQPGDVVICSPQITWLFHAPATDILQAVAATGRDVAFYPAGLPLNRFRYDPRMTSARFLVVDDFMRELAAQVPDIAQAMRAAQSWPVVAQVGEYTVYRRP